MDLILRADVDGLGHKGDVVEVADGYGRNYLLPRGLAMKVTDGARAQADAMARARSVADAESRGAAEEIATRLVPQIITIGAHAGEEGKLFGSVGATEIVEAVAAQADIELDRKRLALDQPLKELGTHHVQVKLHPEVSFPVTVEVIAD